MSIGILNNALSGLLVSQRSLEVASNNIANVNVPGYSQQRTEQISRDGGSGVEVASIVRSYDQFLTSQVRASSSAFGEADTFFTLASRIDNMLADADVGLSPAMKSFFTAFNDLANDPTSLSARQSVLSESEAMTNLVNSTGDRFAEMRQQTNGTVSSLVQDLNTYAGKIADLNKQIVASINSSGGRQLPNTLLDQRDQLLAEMSKIVDISVVPVTDGAVNVFFGIGQPLVVNYTASTLNVANGKIDPLHKEVVLNGNNVTPLLTGGKLTGALRFRDEVLDPAQQQLGLVVTGLAVEFNKLHATGFDLNGNPGSANFFDLGSPNVQINGNASDPNLSVSGSFVMPGSAAVLASAYRLDILPGSTYSLTNLDDQSVVASGALPPASAGFGFNFTVDSGSLTTGDSFTISSTYDVVRTIHVNSAISPRQIAAAGVAGAVGDNSVALNLAKLESGLIMQNGKATLDKVYGQLVAAVGSKTHSASIGRSAQEVLLNQATSAKENSAGVNLDEEAADLIKYQYSYQAAAKAISIANTLFDTLIGAVR